MEKELKPIKNDTDSVNENAFKKLRMLNKLFTIAKETLKSKIKRLAYVHTNRKIFDFNVFRRLVYFILLF